MLLVATVFMMIAPVNAWADCPSSPVDWDAADCDVGGDAVCEAVATGGGEYKWVCDVSGSSEAASVTTVSDYDGNQIASWGDEDGEEFCCPWTNGIITAVETHGSDYDDTLTHSFPPESANLEEYGYDGATYYSMTATIWGADGDDTIKGSPSNHTHPSTGAVSYSEILYGQGDADTIRGYAGPDEIHGGAKNDTLYGGPHEDEIYGDDGNDTIDGGDHDDTISGGNGDDVILGGPGDDTIDGGDGEDQISGGGDDDIIDGGPGGDIICGDAETTTGDQIDDGDDSTTSPRNQIWGANTADDIHCGADNTWIDMSSDFTGDCLDVLTSKPAYCP